MAGADERYYKDTGMLLGYLFPSSSSRLLQPVPTIVEMLTSHGCRDLTSMLDLSASSVIAVAGGGFGDVYTGALKYGQRVAIKCARLQFGNDSGNKTFKASPPIFQMRVVVDWHARKRVWLTSSMFGRSFNIQT
jgi:hypothetical protein